MPMLTVRLTDEEMARLKEIAAGTSVAKVVREWIEASHLLMRGESLPVAAVSHETLPDQAPLPGGTTAIVDGKYERQERTVKGYAGSVPGYISAYVQSNDETVLIPVPEDAKRRNPDDQMALPGSAKKFKLHKPVEDARAAFKAATEHLSDDEVDTAAKVAKHPHAPQEMTVAEWDSQHPTTAPVAHLTKPIISDTQAASIDAGIGRTTQRIRSEIGEFPSGTFLPPLGTVGAKPSFLAAPDEDCVCGHDRHSFHLAGPCTGFVGKTRCTCTGFLADLGF